MADDNASDMDRHHWELWKQSIDAEERAAQSFDKSILTLSGGALLLSITFLQYIAPEPILAPALFAAWLGFIGSLVTMLASLLTSQCALRQLRELIDARYCSNGQSVQQKEGYATATKYLNVASIILFVGGVISLAIFSMANMPTCASQ